MNEIVKVSLISGEPKIARMEVIDGYVSLDLLTTGLSDGDISITTMDEEICVSVNTDSKYIGKSSFKLKSEVLDFRNFTYRKSNGLLSIDIPVFEEDDYNDEPTTIVV